MDSPIAKYFPSSLFLILLFSAYSYSADHRSPYPDEINVNGRVLKTADKFPENFKNELKGKGENAVDDIAKIYEQVDWGKYADASCEDIAFLDEPNFIMAEQIRTNANARQRIKNILKKNPKSNARYMLLRYTFINNRKASNNVYGMMYQNYPDLADAAVDFTTDTDRGTRYMALLVLADQKNSRYSADFKKVLATENDKCVRALAAKGLALLEDQSGYDEISKLLNESDDLFVCAAAQALEQVKTGRARMLIEQAMIKEAAKPVVNQNIVAQLVETMRQITGEGPNDIRARYFGGR